MVLRRLLGEGAREVAVAERQLQVDLGGAEQDARERAAVEQIVVRGDEPVEFGESVVGVARRQVVVGPAVGDESPEFLRDPRDAELVEISDGTVELERVEVDERGRNPTTHLDHLSPAALRGLGVALGAQPFAGARIVAGHRPVQRRASRGVLDDEGDVRGVGTR